MLYLQPDFNIKNKNHMETGRWSDATKSTFLKNMVQFNTLKHRIATHNIHVINCGLSLNKSYCEPDASKSTRGHPM